MRRFTRKQATAALSYTYIYVPQRATRAQRTSDKPRSARACVIARCTKVFSPFDFCAAIAAGVREPRARTGCCVCVLCIHGVRKSSLNWHLGEGCGVLAYILILNGGNFVGETFNDIICRLY